MRQFHWQSLAEPYNNMCNKLDEALFSTLIPLQLLNWMLESSWTPFLCQTSKQSCCYIQTSNHSLSTVSNLYLSGTPSSPAILHLSGTLYHVNLVLGTRYLQRCLSFKRYPSHLRSSSRSNTISQKVETKNFQKCWVTTNSFVLNGLIQEELWRFFLPTARQV